MSETIRQQRITLRVQGESFPLFVPAPEERYFRLGEEEIAMALSSYARRFPDEPDMTHLRMAAIDIAYRCTRWREASQTRDLAEHLRSLASEADRVYSKYSTLLEELEA